MELDLDFSRTPTLASASQSEALFKVVIGSAGSGKTSWAFKEMVRRAIQQEPAADGTRYFKLLVVRNTFQVLKSATLDTAKRTIGPVADFRESIPPVGYIKFNLEDDTQVDMKIEFISFDTEDSFNKLLGFEPTGVILDEISELPEALVFAVIRRLGRYPSGNLGTPTWTGVLGVTNGPRQDHWLYQWSKGFSGDMVDVVRKMEAETGRPYFHLFQQPPALLRPQNDMDGWQPNPKAENVENLPGGYGYYYSMLADADEANIMAYVEGIFAPIKTGTRVFPEFKQLHQINPKDWKLPMDAPIGLSFDFGRTPVCVLWTEFSSGRTVIFDSFMGEDMSVDMLLQDDILPALRGKYSRNRVEWCTGDPAGSVGAQSVEMSPYDVILESGLPVQAPATSNKLQPRLEAVQQYLRKLDTFGNPMLQVVESQIEIVDSLGKNYIYEKVNKYSDRVKDTPTKSHEGWVSDLADAVQYACLLRSGMLRTKLNDRVRDLPPLEANWGLR